MSERTFWGYDSYEQAAKYWPKELLKNPSVSERMVATRSKVCLGRRHDLTFFYKDGSEDMGEPMKIYTVLTKEHEIRWH